MAEGCGGGGGWKRKPKILHLREWDHFWKDNHFSQVEQTSDRSQKDNAPL